MPRENREGNFYAPLIAAMTPDLTADEIVIAPHLTAVRSGDRCGLASTLMPRIQVHGAITVKEPGELAGKPLADLAQLIFSKLPLENSVGMAAINAGLPLAGLDFQEADAAAVLREKAADRNLVMVGHFPFFPQLKKVARSAQVLELDPREGDLPAREAECVIPLAEVVGITGSAFVNNTIEDLLRLAAGKWIMILGPSTPLFPLLFDYGVSVLACSIPTDPEFTLRQVKEGAVFRQLERVRRVVLTGPVRLAPSR